MFLGATVREEHCRGIPGITRATQEDGSINSALVWLSASMTAVQKVDGEKEGTKCGKKKIHRSFLNRGLSLIQKQRACRDAEDQLGVTSSFLRLHLVSIKPSHHLSFSPEERRGFRNGGAVHHRPGEVERGYRCILELMKHLKQARFVAVVVR